MQSLQDAHCEYQGSVTARALLRQLTMTGQSAENWFTFGQVYIREHARVKHARRAHKQALGRASMIKARRWTHRERGAQGPGKQ